MQLYHIIWIDQLHAQVSLVDLHHLDKRYHLKILHAFDISVDTNQFSIGEKVSTGDKEGTVVAWNDNNKYLKVLSNDTFKVGESINGESSKSIALIEQTTKFSSVFNIDSNSEFRSGFRKETGKLSTELQKIADNDYYQTFAYSLQSPIDYDTWKDPVNSLGHVVGFKKLCRCKCCIYRIN